MNSIKKKIIVFLGPSLSHKEASKILYADYRLPIKRGDITAVVNENPDIIGIIDGVFHQQPAVSHREILDALKKGITVVGGASMGALRASELDDFGMIGVGYVYN
ncbi:MAG: TfuA-like protein, partial [Methanobacterium sp.]